MDPYSQYKKQLEYYEYFEKQRENYTDLSQNQVNNDWKPELFDGQYFMNQGE